MSSVLSVEDKERLAVDAVVSGYLEHKGKWILYAKSNPLDKFLLYIAFDAFHRLADFCGFNDSLFDRMCEEAYGGSVSNPRGGCDHTKCKAVRRVAQILHESV